MSIRKDKVNDITVSQLAPASRTTDTTFDVRRQAAGTLWVAVLLGAEGITLDADNRIDLEIRDADDDGAGALDAATLAVCEAGDVVLPVNGPANQQEPDAGGVWAVIDAAGEAPGLYYIGYRGSKEWVRVTVNHVGTHGAGTPYGAIAVLGDLLNSPAP